MTNVLKLSNIIKPSADLNRSPDGMLKGSFTKPGLIREAENFFDTVFYNNAYLCFISLIVMVCWYTENEIAALGFFSLFGSLLLTFRKDLSPVIPILFIVAMIFPKDIDPMTYAPYMPLLAPLPVAAVLHIIRFRHKLRRGKLFFPLIAVSAALFLGGVGSISADRYASGLTYILLLGVVELLIYVFSVNFIETPYDVDLRNYIANAMLYSGMIIVFQISAHYMRNPEALFQIGWNVSLGWAIGNNFATVLLLMLPACFYFAKTSRFAFGYLLIAVLEYLAIVVSWSRGATLLAAIILPMFLVALLVKSKGNLKNLLISLGVLLVLFAVAFGIFFDKITEILKGILDQGIGDSGRFDLYKEAWQCFLNNPVFGAGIGFDGNYYKINNMPMYWFHSTLFQIIGSMGLAGIAAYVWFYVARYKIVVKKDFFNIFLLIGFIGFEGYSMIDTGTFVPVPIMMIVIILTAVLELTNAPDKNIGKCPVKNKISAACQKLKIRRSAKH